MTLTILDKQLDKQLLEAAANGNNAEVGRLLNSGANVDFQNVEGYSPLHCAAENGHAKIVDLLIEAGANVDAKDADQQTPLRVAVEFVNAEVLAVLIAKGADVNAKDINNEGLLYDTQAGSDIYNRFISAVAERIFTSQSNKPLKLEDIQDERQRKAVEARLRELQGEHVGSHAAKVAAEGQSVPSPCR